MLILHSLHKHRSPLPLNNGVTENKKKWKRGSMLKSYRGRKTEEDEGLNSEERDPAFPCRTISDCKWFKGGGISAWSYVERLLSIVSQIEAIHLYLSAPLSEIFSRVFMLIYVTFMFISLLAFFFLFFFKITQTLVFHCHRVWIFSWFY